MAATIGTRHYIQENQTHSQAIDLSYPILKNSSLGINNKSYIYYPSDDEDDEEEEEETFNLKSLPVEPSTHDPRDAATPDSWILRHPSLIRLTGKHPFNSEPPLDLLMHHGFITPTSVHYVRNHGSVPKADWNTWKIDVSGLVAAPMTLTMNQLVNEFPSYDVPVTLACAGNRRNEQNMVKKTKGFNWGPSAISTSVWRGVRLYDLLKRCRIMKRKEGAMNVCFEGGEDLPSGKYGTSIKREFAMDRSRDILIAYMQNGEYLLPDHGFPVRVILPGFIGGRMVKWLKRIVVAPSESDSYYHYKDNKVFPAHVDAELANVEAWWYKPEYIINELNINSVITTPGHEEKLPINSATTHMPYTMKGYAYSGGGKKVTRVEVTLNGGETWLVCTIERHEKPNKYGKYWCWCFWSLQVEVLDLLSAKEIAVRACDETLNTQPENLNWNLMGMMNNCWFRVKVNFFRPNRGEIGLIFEHPTQPGKQSEGWMAKQNHIESTQQSKPLKKSTSTPLMSTSTKQYSLCEVSKHSNEDSPWIIIHNQVYDCTAFIKDHPGGADSIMINAGTDCTEEFEAIHSEKAKQMLDAYRIGELCASTCSSEAIPLPPVQESTQVSAGSSMVALSNPREKIRCTLVSKKIVSKDVRLFRFAFPNQDQVLGLPVGKHIFLSASINGKLCMRAYTPTSSVDAVGYVELLVKIYFKDENGKFPNGGQMSQYLESLTMGSTIDIKGPVGHIEYKGEGNFVVDGKPKFGKKLAMVAGGTGITPLYQVIQAVLQNQENDKTEMHLVYANRTEADVLLKDELDRWQKEHPEQFRVWYVCSDVKDKEGWKYSVGRVDECVLRSGVPLGGCEDTLALACGPPQMIQSAVIPNLKKMDYDVKNSFLLF